jgi:surface antigen
MKKNCLYLLCTLSAFALVSGCSTNPFSPDRKHEEYGYTSGTAFFGKAIDARVTKEMTVQDRFRAGHSLEVTPNGVTDSWVNAENGIIYSLTPTNTYQNGMRPCRTYTLQSKIGGQAHKIYGTACRTPSGIWEVIESNP